MTSVHRSIFFSAAERYASVVLFFISTGVLSRLLTPKEFGIYAVVNALTTVVAVSSQEFGGANYLIQKGELSEGNIRTAFTITLCLSVTIGVGFLLLGGVLGTLFGEEGLRTAIAIAAINFAITPFSTTITALLRRKLQFGDIAVASLAGNFAMVLVSIALAAMGWSYFAPICGTIAGSVVQAFYLMATRDNLRIFRPSADGYGDVVKFGLYSSGVLLINAFYNSAPQLFLARVLDFASVGLYSRAVNVIQVFDKLVTQVIGPVIMPAIFAQTKAGADLKRVYLDAISLLTVLHWPFLILVALMAKPLILIWLGASWLDVVPLVRILCIAYLSLFAACLTYPVLVAAGSVRDAMVSSLISLPPSLLAIFAASFLGVEAVAASALLTLPFQAAVAVYFVGRHLELRASDIVQATQKSGIVTLCTGAAGATCSALYEYGVIGSLASMFLTIAVAGAAWLTALIVIQHPMLPPLRAAASGLHASWRVRFPLAVPTIRRDGDAY
jgi:O-antigen/teichoic acid export membrane protein